MNEVCNSPNNPEQTILGFFRTNITFPFGQFTINSHKDYKNLYHFKISEGFFYYPVVKELCHDKFGETALESINDVDDIPVDKLEEAREKIKEQYYYGKGTTYLLKEVYWLHEGIHEDDFRKAIPEVLAEEVPEEINELFHEKTSFKNAFSKFTLSSDDLVLAEYTYRLILKWFDYNLRMHPKRSEQKVQQNTIIRNRINAYIDAIQNRIDRINKGIN